MKAVRKFNTKKQSFWNIVYLSDCFDPIYKLIQFFIRWEKTKRFFYWGWKLRDSYDFDSGTVYEMLALKYERIYKVLENGHCCHAKSHMKRLKTIIGLAERLSKDDYLSQALIPVEQRWGELQMHWNDLPEGRSILSRTTLSKTKTDKENTIAKKEWSNASSHSDAMEKADKQLLWALIAKYNDYFWD